MSADGPFHLDHVAEIEATRQYTVEHPTPPPAEPRDLLHLAPIEAWQAIASDQPAPHIDSLALQQTIYEAFATGNGISPVALSVFSGTHERSHPG
jgi:hypothetical protein